jgi:NADH:ubiquinone oxidoreductase subunit H
MVYLAVRSVHVYSVIMAGWCSNSSYSIFGAIRSIAQTISFEIPLATIILLVCIIKASFELSDFFYCVFFPLLWVIISPFILA